MNSRSCISGILCLLVTVAAAVAEPAPRPSEVTRAYWEKWDAYGEFYTARYFYYSGPDGPPTDMTERLWTPGGRDSAHKIDEETGLPMYEYISYLDSHKPPESVYQTHDYTAGATTIAGDWEKGFTNLLLKVRPYNAQTDPEYDMYWEDTDVSPIHVIPANQIFRGGDMNDDYYRTFGYLVWDASGRMGMAAGSGGVGKPTVKINADPGTWYQRWRLDWYKRSPADVYSVDVSYVIAHEIGHNVGVLHSHLRSEDIYGRETLPGGETNGPLSVMNYVTQFDLRGPTPLDIAQAGYLQGRDEGRVQELMDDFTLYTLNEFEDDYDWDYWEQPADLYIVEDDHAGALVERRRGRSAGMTGFVVDLDIGPIAFLNTGKKVQWKIVYLDEFDGVLEESVMVPDAEGFFTPSPPSGTASMQVVAENPYRSKKRAGIIESAERSEALIEVMGYTERRRPRMIGGREYLVRTYWGFAMFPERYTDERGRDRLNRASGVAMATDGSETTRQRKFRVRKNGLFITPPVFIPTDWSSSRVDVTATDKTGLSVSASE